MTWSAIESSQLPDRTHQQFCAESRCHPGAGHIWDNHVSTTAECIANKHQSRLWNKLPTHFYRNNVAASTLSSAGVGGVDVEVLLGNPQSYLDTVDEDRADVIRHHLTPAYQKAFRVVFLVGACLCAGAFVVGFFMMPQVELSRPDDAKLKEEGRRAQAEKGSASKA